MGFDLSTMLGIMWNHPLLCGSVLLLLTPSLFHIVLYFSPLLISTALFIVALISMGPRMEETQQERETWAKGEKPLEPDSNWPYTDWTAPDLEPLNPQKKPRAADEHGSNSWLDLLEEGKSRLAIWIDNMYKASELKQPLVLVPEAAAPPTLDEKQTPVSDQVSPPASSEVPAPAPAQVSELEKQTLLRPVPEIEEVVDDVKTVEVDVVPPAPAPQAVVAAPAPPVDGTKVSEKELDMPELEIVEVPQAELAAAEMVAAEVLAEKVMVDDDQPIWDEPVDHPECLDKVDDLRAPLRDDELMDVPLNDPVQEPVHEKQHDQPLPRSSSKKSGKLETSPGSPSPGIKHVRFLSESSAGSPPPPVRDVILKNLQNQLDELQAKKRNKYTQILSRRMSSKNGTRQH